VNPDFGRTADDYASHRAGFPDSLFERLSELGIGLEGQDVVDLGTGTGTLGRGFARRGCRVIGIDPAAEMLEKAKALDAKEGLRTEYRVARAEQTSLENACADAVGAGQCWHWFDRRAAAAEVVRLLRPDGFIVIAHFDWLPLSGNVVRMTEKLIEAHNPDWKMGGGVGVHPWWLRDLGEAGFRELTSFSYDVNVSYTPEAWRGRIRASAGVAASLSAERVTAFDVELAALLSDAFPGAQISIPHRVFAVVGRRPEA